MTGLIKVRSDIDYFAIEISDHAGDRQVIARWLMDAGMIPSDEWSIERAKQLNDDLDQLQSSYIIKAPGGEVTIVSLEDFTNSFYVVGEGDVLDELEEEFKLPELDPELKEQGDFTTEIIWQCFEETERFPAGWWDAKSREDAVSRTNKSAQEFGTDVGVRSRTQVSVIGPWKTEAAA